MNTSRKSTSIKNKKTGKPDNIAKAKKTKDIIKDNQCKSGDTIVIQLKKEKKELRGICLASPASQQNVLFLKLENGYNIGIEKANISSVKNVTSQTTLAKVKEKKSTVHTALPSKVAGKNKLPVIALLHTGGTIASKVDYKQGGVSADFSAEELIAMFPELATFARVKPKKIMQLQSEMMRFSHFNTIAKEVYRAIKTGVDGVIITHGTDTLHYSAAALAFSLGTCPVPVLFVGAQRSADRGSSDAGENLLNAVFFIAQQKQFSGVAICMHESLSDEDALILPATKSRKMHTSRRDAFRPINAPPLARVNYHTGKCSFIDTPPNEEKTIRSAKVSASFSSPQLFKENLKIGILKQHPNISAEQFLFFKGYDGLLIEGTGLGHIANQQIDGDTGENKHIQEAVSSLVSGGTVVAVASQCIYGRIHLAVYSPLRELAQAGVIGHFHDMTPETAFIKLAWLLSNYSKEETKTLFTKNLRGEISDSSPDAFLF